MMRLRVCLMCVLGSVAFAVAAQVPGSGSAPTTSGESAATTPVVPPRGFTYESGGRRDPFVSVLRTGADPVRPGAIVRRPPGLAGLSVSEVSLKGTVVGSGGFVAILQGIDGKTYIVREGERLFDATVKTITQNTLTLLQTGSDPSTKDAPREVQKVLRQTDEAR